MYQGVIRDEIRVREKAAALKNSTPPLNPPSAPVQQPARMIDENCETCRISPPPQLLEAQTSEERRKEREARGKEYLEQKGLGERLVKEQGRGEGTRMIEEIGGESSQLLASLDQGDGIDDLCLGNSLSRRRLVKER